VSESPSTTNSNPSHLVRRSWFRIAVWAGESRMPNHKNHNTNNNNTNIKTNNNNNNNNPTTTTTNTATSTQQLQ
jgi:hypothetical protein